MCKKFTPDELNKMDHKTKDDVIYQMKSFAAAFVKLPHFATWLT